MSPRVVGTVTSSHLPQREYPETIMAILMRGLRAPAAPQPIDEARYSTRSLHPIPAPDPCTRSLSATGSLTPDDTRWSSFRGADKKHDMR
jgi:hypothetical protein